ncbi:MAG: BrnA antitoxin family protein [Patescibacteria group bacterium]
MKKKVNIPKFKGEDQERAFWGKFDLATHFQPEDFDAVAFPDLKPSSRPVSIRVPEYLLVRLKERANELNIPYQSLMKEYIARGVLRK